MKIGLFFGSFNPIHTGHLIIANYMVEFTAIERVWFVVTPQNPLKKRRSLLNEYDRLELVRLAIEDDPRLDVTDIEFYLPRPSYTIHTLLHLEEKFPGNQFSLVMGSDSLKTLPKWKNYEELLKNYSIYVYPRPGNRETKHYKEKNVHVADAPLMKISASFIRKCFVQDKSARYMVPLKVLEIIEKWGYYKK